MLELRNLIPYVVYHQGLKYDGKGHESYPFPFELRSVVTLGDSVLTQVW